MYVVSRWKREWNEYVHDTHEQIINKLFKKIDGERISRNFKYDVSIIIFEITRYFYDQLDLLKIGD